MTALKTCPCRHWTFTAQELLFSNKKNICTGVPENLTIFEMK